MHHFLESIYGHDHRHTEVLCILDLFPHVAAALLQQLEVLCVGTHKHTFKETSEKVVKGSVCINV